tara:strand:- start:258 stop:485 length:228 start_codon:yes stop_codon:yes gene_type:complete
MMNPQQMILFGIEFMQMMEDFYTDTLCPACRHESRSNLICLRDECDFVLFTDYGESIHPAFWNIVAETKERLSKK